MLENPCTISYDAIYQVFGIIKNKCTAENDYTYISYINIPTQLGPRQYKLTVKQYNVDEMGFAKTTTITVKEED